MPSLTDFLNPPTAEDVAHLQLNMLALAGMPVTHWQPGSVPLSLVDADAQTLGDMAQVIATVTQSGFASLAVGPWLDLIGLSQFNEPRKQPVKAQGWLTLTDAGGGGPYTINPYQLYAGPSSTLRFQNTTNGVLPKNGTAVLSFDAEEPGAAYNLANEAIANLLTPLPGVTVTNVDPGPLYANGGTGTWLSRVGVDAESDAAYFARLQAKWATLATGGPDGAYRFRALSATAAITRANVLSATPTGGQVTIYCAGPAGPPLGTDMDVVRSAIAAHRPLCVTVNVYPATANEITLSGTVVVQKAFAATAQAIFDANLAVYVAALAIGAPVYVSKLISLIQSIPGVVEVVLSPISPKSCSGTATLTDFVTLTDASIDFVAAGVAMGDTVVLSSGPDARIPRTIATVAAHTLVISSAFTNTAPAYAIYRGGTTGPQTIFSTSSTLTDFSTLADATTNFTTAGIQIGDAIVLANGSTRTIATVAAHTLTVTVPFTINTPQYSVYRGGLHDDVVQLPQQVATFTDTLTWVGV